MRPWPEQVTIGRVMRPQGRKGELLVHVLSDRPDRFPALRRVLLPEPGGGTRVRNVVSTWPHKGQFVIKLEGVDSIDEAEAFRGLELRIDQDELAALPAGSYYHHQLLGLLVLDGSGRELGRVAELMETGGATVLVVRGEGGETLVPLAEPFLRQVDLAAGRMVVEWAEAADARG